MRIQTGKAKKGKTKTIRMTVSVRLHTYLGYLSRNTLLGPSENDVARQILTTRLDEMLRADYHEKKLPSDTTTELSPTG